MSGENLSLWLKDLFGSPNTLEANAPVLKTQENRQMDPVVGRKIQKEQAPPVDLAQNLLDLFAADPNAEYGDVLPVARQKASQGHVNLGGGEEFNVQQPAGPSRLALPNMVREPLLSVARIMQSFEHPAEATASPEDFAKSTMLDVVGLLANRGLPESFTGQTARGEVIPFASRLAEMFKKRNEAKMGYERALGKQQGLEEGMIPNNAEPDFSTGPFEQVKPLADVVPGPNAGGEKIKQQPFAWLNKEGVATDLSSVRRQVLDEAHKTKLRKIQTDAGYSTVKELPSGHQIMYNPKASVIKYRIFDAEMNPVLGGSSTVEKLVAKMRARLADNPELYSKDYTPELLKGLEAYITRKK